LNNNNENPDCVKSVKQDRLSLKITANSNVGEQEFLLSKIRRSRTS